MGEGEFNEWMKNQFRRRHIWVLIFVSYSTEREFDNVGPVTWNNPGEKKRRIYLVSHVVIKKKEEGKQVV